MTASPSRMATGARNTTFSIIGSDVVITGNVTASVDLHVDGRIDGDLSCANLVQGADSFIKGAIQADSARLSGTVDGSIAARDLVIQASAKISGDVSYENLTIEQGSQVDGRFSPRRVGSSQGQRAAALPGATTAAPAAKPTNAELLPAAE